MNTTVITHQQHRCKTYKISKHNQSHAPEYQHHIMYSVSQKRCWIFTTQSSYANVVLGIVILCVCLSVHHTRALWQTKKHTAEILTPHERVINLVFWHQQRLVGNVLFHLKFAPKVTHPSEKCRLRPISAYNVSTVRAREKCSIIANRKSTTHLPTSHTWSAYVTPNSPKGWLKNWICRFCE